MSDLSNIYNLEDDILRMRNPVQYLTKKSKKIKKNNIENDNFILQNLLDNEAKDSYNEITSMIPEVPFSSYHGTPQMAFIANIVQALVKAKLLYDVRHERKINKAKVLNYLKGKEAEKKEEAARLNEIAKETMKTIQEEQAFKKQEREAN
jgi:hypothetical protein